LLCVWTFRVKILLKKKHSEHCAASGMGQSKAFIEWSSEILLRNILVSYKTYFRLLLRMLIDHCSMRHHLYISWTSRKAPYAENASTRRHPHIIYQYSVLVMQRLKISGSALLESINTKTASIRTVLSSALEPELFVERS
jgi:hypothetical protein